MNFHKQAQVHSKNPGEEQSYRRGFSQGVAALAYGLGMEPSKYHRTSFEKQVADFRAGRRKTAPWKLSSGQLEELRDLLKLDQQEAQ